MLKSYALRLAGWLGILSLLLPLTARAAANDGRQVEFAWDATPAAQSYEIEFKKRHASASASLIKKTATAGFSGSVASGHYDVRIRAIDQRGVPGPWSDPIDLLVPFPPPEVVSPGDGKRLKGTSSDQSSVTFQWRPVADAAAYLVQVSPEPTGTAFDQKVADTELTINLPVAQAYSWKIRAVSVDNESGEASDAHLFTLLGEPLATPDPELSDTDGQRQVKWTKSEFAQTFDLKLQQRQGSGWRVVSKMASEKATTFPLASELSPGEYRFVVVAKADKRLSSKPGIVTFKIDKPVTVSVAPPTVPPWLRLAAAYTPMYWEHGTDAGDKSGVDFDILIFDAFQADIEAYFWERRASVELLYGYWETQLFGESLPGSGIQGGQKPLNLKGQDLALKAKYFFLVSVADFSLVLGMRRSSAFFFYKDTPSTIALLASNANYLTVEAELNVPLWTWGEWRGWAETDQPLGGQGFTIKNATDYRLNANLIDYVVGRRLALLFLYQFDYKHWFYTLNNPATSGRVVDESHMVGAGLEVNF